MTVPIHQLKEPVVSPLARLHRDQEQRWRSFLDTHFPGARSLLRWGPHHRVYRCADRVVKVEWETKAAADPSRGLAYEFALLEALEGRASRLDPSYRVIDGGWCVLEMDRVEGEYLDDLIYENRAREVSVLRLVAKLFHVSMAGVAYKQLRGRHVILCTDGDIAFIDFGDSSRAGPLAALWANFAPLSFAGGALQWGRLFSIIREIMRRREAVEGRDDDVTAQALRRWRSNGRRTAKALPENLADDPGDAEAARHFAAMENCLVEAVAAEPRIAVDLIGFQFAEYGMAGNRDWGFIWDHLAARVDFAGKSVVDLACGMGGVGGFARLSGAARVDCYESHPQLLDAARHFSEALGFADNDYHRLDWADIALCRGDVITALSARLDDVPREQLLDSLTRYPEIFWQTSDPQTGRRELAARGYKTVEVVVRVTTDQYVLYATGCAT